MSIINLPAFLLRGYLRKVDIQYIVCLTHSKKVPGRSAGCPSAPPTVPYVKVSLIRFLGNRRLYANG